MKTLRILILAVAIPVFVLAMLADAIDQDSMTSRTLQISSLTDDLDLPCHKIKQPIALNSLPTVSELLPACPYTVIHVSALNANTQIHLPYFLRPPPVC